MKKKKMALFLIILLVVIAGILFYIKYKQDQSSAELNIYLVTNTQTQSDEQGLLVGGEGNARLTAQGIEDSRELGLGLMSIKFDAVYCSTLDRAYQTTENILNQSGQKNLDIEEKQNLRDIMVGNAQGYVKEDITAQYGDIFGAVSDEAYTSPTGGESAYAFAQRFERDMNKIIDAHKEDGGNVLVVAHPSLLYYLQQQFPENVKETELAQGSVSVVTYQDKELSLTACNSTGYLQKGKTAAQTIPSLEIEVIANPATIHQEAGLLEGTTDSGLSTAGINDAKALAGKLELGNVLAVYCSSLDRSKETESYIIKDDDMKVYYTKDLDEISFGVMEAGRMENLEELYARQVRRIHSEDMVNAVQPEAGESGEIAAYRLKRVLDEIVEDYEYSGGKIIVFTHPYILSAYMNEYFPDNMWNQNGSIRWTTLKYENEIVIKE